MEKKQRKVKVRKNMSKISTDLIKKLREKASNEVLSPEFMIEVDGGINDKTIR